MCIFSVHLWPVPLSEKICISFTFYVFNKTLKHCWHIIDRNLYLELTSVVYMNMAKVRVFYRINVIIKRFV